MGNILVILILVLAVAYIGRAFYRGSKKQAACGCGCSACGDDPSCSEQTEKKLLDT